MPFTRMLLSHRSSGSSRYVVRFKTNDLCGTSVASDCDDETHEAVCVEPENEPEISDVQHSELEDDSCTCCSEVDTPDDVHAEVVQSRQAKTSPLSSQEDYEIVHMVVKVNRVKAQTMTDDWGDAAAGDADDADYGLSEAQLRAFHTGDSAASGVEDSPRSRRSFSIIDPHTTRKMSKSVDGRAANRELSKTRRDLFHGPDASDEKFVTVA